MRSLRLAVVGACPMPRDLTWSAPVTDRRPHHRRRRRLPGSGLAGAASVQTCPGLACAPAPAATAGADAARVVAGDTADLATASWWRDAMDVDERHRTATGKGITVAVINGPLNAQVRLACEAVG